MNANIRKSNTRKRRTPLARRGILLAALLASLCGASAHAKPPAKATTQETELVCSKSAPAMICSKAANYADIVEETLLLHGLKMSQLQKQQIATATEASMSAQLNGLLQLGNSKVTPAKLAEVFHLHLVEAIVKDDVDAVMEEVDEYFDLDFALRLAAWHDEATGGKLPGVTEKPIAGQDEAGEELVDSIEQALVGEEPPATMTFNDPSAIGPALIPVAIWISEASAPAVVAWAGINWRIWSAPYEVGDTAATWTDDNGNILTVVDRTADGNYVVMDDMGNESVVTRGGAVVDQNADDDESSDDDDEAESDDEQPQEEGEDEDDEAEEQEDESSDDDDSDCDPTIQTCEDEGGGDDEGEDGDEDDETDGDPDGYCIDAYDDCGSQEMIMPEHPLLLMLFNRLFGQPDADLKDEEAKMPHVNWGENIPGRPDIILTQEEAFDMWVEAVSRVVNWGPDGPPVFNERKALPKDIVDPSVNPGK